MIVYRYPGLGTTDLELTKLDIPKIEMDGEVVEKLALGVYALMDIDLGTDTTQWPQPEITQAFRVDGGLGFFVRLPNVHGRGWCFWFVLAGTTSADLHNAVLKATKGVAADGLGLGEDLSEEDQERVYTEAVLGVVPAELLRPPFRITYDGYGPDAKAKGFQLGFKNGLTVSVQWGERDDAHRSDLYDGGISADLAIWREPLHQSLLKNDKFLQLSDHDRNRAHVSVETLVMILYAVAQPCGLSDDELAQNLRLILDQREEKEYFGEYSDE